jgi:hypothetical protein
MTTLRKIQLGILIAAAVSALVAMTSCGTDRAVDCFDGCNMKPHSEPVVVETPATCTATEMELWVRVECTTGLVLVVDKPVVGKVIPADVVVSPAPTPPPACTVIDQPEIKGKKKDKERRHE